MATDRDTLKFQKEGSSDVKDLYVDFGFKTTSVPLFVPLDRKPAFQRDWADEDGLDAYAPDGMKLAAYETEVSVVYHGAYGSGMGRLSSLMSYLDGCGVDLNIYSPYSSTGCKGANFLGISSPDYHSSDSDGDVLVVSLRFNVNKPGDSFSV